MCPGHGGLQGSDDEEAKAGTAEGDDHAVLLQNELGRRRGLGSHLEPYHRTYV